MHTPKILTDIEQMVRNQVQENIHLDYKDSRALTNKGARDSLAKDASAFANSDGGVLIYGVEENGNLPVRIDAGVDDARCSREWIESAIMTGITPRLDDVTIIPVPLSAGRSLYVVETAKTFRGPHQSSDKRYYKRHNFMSVPMEDYEVNDVRNRRKQRSPLVIFKVSEYRRFIAAFDVGNVGAVVAEDVRFEFSTPMPWPLQQDGVPPVLFAKGTAKFPPQQWFRFLYCPFHEILSGAKGVPIEFSVRISYYHPEAATRVSDEWHVNFGVYMHSTAVRPEIEEHAKDIVENLEKMTRHLDSLHKDLEHFKTIRGSTGLDLSLATLRTLKRTLVDRKDPERIPPQDCDVSVFRELLGVDVQMAFNIFDTIGRHDTPEKLRDIPGMNTDLMAKIHAVFVLPSESAEQASEQTE
jgi:hypothetical protein